MQTQPLTRIIPLDPNILKKYDVVVTTYETVQSEYSVYVPPVKDASSATSKKKKALDSDDSDSDLEESMARIKAKSTRKPPAKKCALYGVRWWRVVLGTSF